MTIIFFDFETTGLDHEKDEIIQFFFLNSTNQTQYSSFVNPGKQIPPFVTKLTGITNDDVACYKKIEYYIHRIFDFIDQKETVYLVGHNSDNFDKPFLKNALQRIHYEIPKNWCFIDTLKIARKLLPSLLNYKLDTLRENYKLSNSYAHLASKDVLDLEKIYYAMAKQRTPEEMYALTKKKYNKMPFGKHKGKLFSEIPKDYFFFLLEKGIVGKDTNSDLFESLQAYIA